MTQALATSPAYLGPEAAWGARCAARRGAEWQTLAQAPVSRGADVWVAPTALRTVTGGRSDPQGPGKPRCLSAPGSATRAEGFAAS